MTSSLGGRLAVRAVLAAMLSGSAAICFANVALKGVVYDEAGGALPRATISLHKLSGDKFDASSQTDSGGSYSFPELPDGEYSVEATLLGFIGVSYKPIRIYFPAQVRRDFVLAVAFVGGDAVYASSELVGELMWKGARVPHANICLSRLDGPYRPICTTTNQLGQYYLDVPPEKYNITVNGDGGLSRSQPLDLSTAGEYRNRIGLPDSGK